MSATTNSEAATTVSSSTPLTTSPPVDNQFVLSTTMPRTYLCCNRYLLLEKLGKGGFGLIYAGIDITNGTRVAIKLEDTAKARKKYLKLEYKIYQRYESEWFCQPFTQEASVPKVYFYGQEGGFRVLVMDLLGPSLSELLTYQFERFTLKSTLMLGIKMITSVEFLHAKGLLHRDIKPGNFVLGRGVHGNDVYLIDYGLASSYLDPRGDHIPYNANARFHGTDKYASKHNHQKIEPGRRDDLESLGYLLIYFITGNLPWAKKYARVKKQHRRALYGKVKADISIKELTRDVPSNCRESFAEYFTYVMNLGFADKPDYNYLRKILFTEMANNRFTFDNEFDWTVAHAPPEKVTTPRPSNGATGEYFFSAPSFPTN